MDSGALFYFLIRPGDNECGKAVHSEFSSSRAIRHIDIVRARDGLHDHLAGALVQMLDLHGLRQSRLCRAMRQLRRADRHRHLIRGLHRIALGVLDGDIQRGQTELALIKVGIRSLLRGHDGSLCVDVFFAALCICGHVQPGPFGDLSLGSVRHSDLIDIVAAGQSNVLRNDGSDDHVHREGV